MLLALIGASKSRKTWVRKALVKLHGFEAMHIGEPVKDAGRALGLSKAQVDGALKDEPTQLLRGQPPRALLEAISAALHETTPHLIGDLARAKILRKLGHGHSLVVDGVRSQEQAAAMRKLGAKIVRTDRGRELNPDIPSDMEQAAIVQDHILDTSGSKADRRAKLAAMFADLDAAHFTRSAA